MDEPQDPMEKCAEWCETFDPEDNYSVLIQVNCYYLSEGKSQTDLLHEIARLHQRIDRLKADKSYMDKVICFAGKRLLLVERFLASKKAEGTPARLHRHVEKSLKHMKFAGKITWRQR